MKNKSFVYVPVCYINTCLLGKNPGRTINKDKIRTVMTTCSRQIIK